MSVAQQPSAPRSESIGPGADGSPGPTSPGRRPPWWRRIDVHGRPRPAAERRAGYVAAAIVNSVLLWVAHQLLDWGWPSFLTPEFDEVLPIVSASFVASIVANVLFVVHDPPWFRSLLDAVTSAISLTAGIRVLQVFPFDFSTWGTDWSWLVRTVLVVGVVATAIAVVVHTVRLLDEAIRLGLPDRAAEPTGSDVSDPSEPDRQPPRRPGTSRKASRITSG
jgi:hypothetical protein